MSLKLVHREKEQKPCPYAMRVWSSAGQWQPGCKQANTDYCGGDGDCALIPQAKAQGVKPWRQ
jgi:hypothetical protein